MNQPRYTLSTVSAAVTSPVIARLAFVLLLVVAGSEHSFADIDNDAIASGFYAGNQVDSNIASASVPVVPGAPALVITKVATPDTNVRLAHPSPTHTQFEIPATRLLPISH